MRVLFYSSVKTRKMFSIQSYYRNDIHILRELGYIVSLTHNICQFLQFWSYDIAFLYFYRYSLFPALIAKCFGKRIYFTGGIDYLDRSFAAPNQRRLQALFFKLCNLLADGSIIVSTTDWDNIQELYDGKIPKNCIKSFHSIAYEQFVYDGDYTDKKPIVSTIAWMVNLDNVFRKGIDKSLEAFAVFVKLHPEFRFVIAGPSGEGSNYMIQLVEELQISQFVDYKGIITEREKISLLKESSIYMQLSQYEGFGIAAVEALASGNQVVHSGKGGLRDALGEYGYRVNINNTEDIVATMNNAVDSTIDISFMKKGIEYVKQNFSYECRYRDFERIIGKTGSK